MICFMCHQRIKRELDILNLFQKEYPLCQSCEAHLLIRTHTNYHYQHEVISSLDYNAAARDLFHRYKFMGDYCLREVLAIFIDIKVSKYDVVIPIPLSKERLEERGYNQVIEVLDYLKIKYTNCLVAKNRRRQSELTKEERSKRETPFSFKESFDISILTDKKILLVDDIYTTGVTMEHAREVIEKAKPKDIKMLTFSKV